MKKIYYEKKGRKYVPVSEYDSNLLDALPKGDHLISVYPGGSSRRYNIDANYAAMIAAGRVAQDAISDALRKASDLRPSRVPITEEQREAWKRLSEAFGEDSHMLTWPSARDAAEDAVKAMQAEADRMLDNPAVKKAWDYFMMIATLTKEQEKSQ